MVDQSYKNLVAKRNRLDKTWSKKARKEQDYALKLLEVKLKLKLGNERKTISMMKSKNVLVTQGKLKRF